MELRLFWSHVRLFQSIRGFFKLFPDKRKAFSSNVRHFEQFRGFLKTFSEKVWGFYKKYEVSWRHYQRNGGFNKKSEAFSKITRLFEDIFNGIEAFLKCCKKSEAFSKISKLFEDIFNGIEAF
jgi:hypothetical protein